jgi:glycosyltransferase involved in cell wall biosynthesis
MKVAINQVRGNSGVDVWAQNLCEGLQNTGVSCKLDLLPGIYQFCPGLIPFRKTIDNEADIIQSHTWNGFGFRNNTPLVVTEHGVLHDPLLYPYKTLGQKLYHRYIFRFEQKSLAVADAVVCVSEDTRNKLEAVFGYTDAKVIYNGVDTGLFMPKVIDRKIWNLPENKTILLFAGNLSRRKGADLLPSIMNGLGDDFILLTTSGNRNQSQTSIPHSRDLGHLNLHQLIDAYNLCDIFLLPSRLEGLSLSTLEAMACAKPVVAFNCSSFPELVVDGKGGFLPEKDDVMGFAEKIREITADDDLKREMGRFNRKRVEEMFTIEKMTKSYLDVYRSLVR